jgi:hypothetical protein
LSLLRKFAGFDSRDRNLSRLASFFRHPEVLGAKRRASKGQT